MMYPLGRKDRTVGPVAMTALSLFLALASGGCESTKPTAAENSEAARRAADDDEFAKGANLPPTPRTLLAMARVLAAQGRQDESIYVLNRILREHPDFLPAYVDLAQVQLAQGRPDSAMATLSAGQRLAPQDPVLANDLGMCRLLQGDYEQASACFELAAAKAPANLRYQTNRALALGMLGRYDQCLRAYQQVLAPAEAHHNLAVICRARHDQTRADQEDQTAKQLGQVSQAAPPAGQSGQGTDPR